MATKHLTSEEKHEKTETLMIAWAVCLIISAPWIYRITESILTGVFAEALGWAIGAFIAVVFTLRLEGMFIIMFVWSGTLIMTLPESWAETTYYSSIFALFIGMAITTQFEEMRKRKNKEIRKRNARQKHSPSP